VALDSSVSGADASIADAKMDSRVADASATLDSSTRLADSGSDAPSAPDSGTAPPKPDAYGCLDGCNQLAKLGCPEGLDPHCQDVCLKAERFGTFAIKPTCWKSSTNVSSAQKCGIKCQP
jgi:hypothetical protein